MTTEEKLKDLILSRYKSIREFVLKIDMPYTTIDSIFRRGIGNSSVANIIKICKALSISADALAEGKIVSTNQRYFEIKEDPIDINDILADAKARLICFDDLTLEGRPVDDDTVAAITQGIDVSLELAKRHNKNHNKK
jgi:hypothetical protein